MGHARLKNLHETGAKLLIFVPGAGLEPARTLPGPRDFKSRVSTKFHHPGASNLNNLPAPRFQPLHPVGKVLGKNSASFFVSKHGCVYSLITIRVRWSTHPLDVGSGC
jgi:hypothetical protein